GRNGPQRDRRPGEPGIDVQWCPAARPDARFGRIHRAVLDDLGSLLTGGATTQNTISGGVSILESLFGGRLSSISDLLARVAGIRVGSASSLLGWPPSAETVTRSVSTREDVRGVMAPAARGGYWNWLLPLLIFAGLALLALSWLWNRETVPPIREA